MCTPAAPRGANPPLGVKLEDAVRAYDTGVLGMSQAAAAAGITKVEFILRLGEFKVSAVATDRIEEDTAVARRCR